MVESRSPVERLRRPEYTGDNRCLPCTVVNVAIAVAVSGAVALVSPPAAAVALALSLASIYLRGYLVPGTPTLTKRYAPRRLLRAVGADPVEARVGGEAVDATGQPDGEGAPTDETSEFETLERVRAEREASVDPEAFLEAAGVVEPAGDSESGYALTAEFAAAARARLPDEPAVDPGRLAPLFGVDPAAMEPLDRDYPAYRVGVRVRKWPSPAAAALDGATFAALDDWTDDWADLPTEQRVDVVEWLRGWYRTCPACGGPVVFREAAVESCCGRFDVTTLSCADCGTHLREFDPAAVGSRETLRGMRP